MTKPLAFAAIMLIAAAFVAYHLFFPGKD